MQGGPAKILGGLCRELGESKQEDDGWLCDCASLAQTRSREFLRKERDRARRVWVHRMGSGRARTVCLPREFRGKRENEAEVKEVGLQSSVDFSLL
jgi:hypothetical protein